MDYNQVEIAFEKFTQSETNAEIVCQEYLCSVLKDRTRKRIKFSDLRPMACYDGKYRRCRSILLCSNGIIVKMEGETCSFDELYARDQFELCSAVEEIINR